MRRLRRNALFAVVLVSAATAYVLPFRQPNCNTSSHYALVQTLATGTATIDAIHGQSCDVSWWHQHYYANKAPGLALVTVPWFVVLRAAGAVRGDPAAHRSYPEAMRALPRRDLWLMGLWGAVLPALGLLVLVRVVADRLSPGSGVVVAAVLAFATLLLPFGSLFFSHALAAFLTFAAFALVLERSASSGRIAAAGVLAGFAAVVEYPAGVLAVLLGLYTIARRPRVRRAATFAAGVVLGLIPLAVYDWWAFGSPTHLSYVGAVLVPGASGHDVLGANSVGFFGIVLPRLGRAMQVLFGSRGLLVIGPVVALAPVGWVLLRRAGRRHEAVFLAAVPVIYVVYNACYYSPLGGATPGPRFLILALPFLAVALAPLVRLYPLSLLSLACCSAALLLAATVTQPLVSAPYTRGSWWHWVRAGSFTSTILSPTSHELLPVAPIVLAALAALAAATRSAMPVARYDVAAAPVAVAVWIVAFAWFPHLTRTSAGAPAIVVVLAIAAVAALASDRVPRRDS